MGNLTRGRFLHSTTAASVGLGTEALAPDASAGAGQAATPWLVMMFLAGDNNLTEEMVLALQDLVAEGPPTGDKIVAQLDPSARGVPTQRYDFTERYVTGTATRKTSLDQFLTDDIIDASTGNVETLRSFIGWAVKKHGGPDRNSTRYLLILAGHGSGITEDFFLSDNQSLDSLTIAELETVLADAKTHIGKKIDVLGMDACHMAMGEVAFAVRDSADILVAAEGLEPEFGWPYRRILAKAKENRTSSSQSMTPALLAKTVVTEYVTNYADYDRAAGRSADLAAIDLTGIVAVADAIRDLGATLAGLSAEDHNKVLLAHWYAQTYKFDQYVDVKDLCTQLQRQFRDPSDIAKQSSAVIAAVDDCVISAGCSGYATQHSHGLSIYFPWSYVVPEYQDCTFATHTGWHEFLEKHVVATRREARYSTNGALPVFLPGTSIEDVRNARVRRLQELIAISRDPDSAPPDDLSERTLVVGLKRFTVPPGEETAVGSLVRRLAGRLETVQACVARADIPPEDIAGEMDRRLLHGTTLGMRPGKNGRYGGEHGRYGGEHGRYGGEHGRFVGDRETWMKNLPPVLGSVIKP
jgi:hypothetical protein